MRLRKDQAALPKPKPQHPVLDGGRFGLISGDAPRFQPEAGGGHEGLAGELKRMGLRHEPTVGQYGTPERSFIVHNPTLSQMKELGRRFGQESIIYSDQGRHELHYTNGPDADLHRPATEIHYFSDKPADDWTALPGPHGARGYFRIPFDFGQPAVPHAVRVAQGIAKAIQDRIDAYAAQLVELRKREYQQIPAHSEPGIHEPAGAPRHREPGAHEKPAEASESQEQSTGPVAKQTAVEENEMSKSITNDPREFMRGLAKHLREVLKNEDGAISAGEVSAEGAAAGIPGSGDHATKAVAKDEISAGESSGEGAGKGIPGSGDHATAAVKKDEMAMSQKMGMCKSCKKPMSPIMATLCKSLCKACMTKSVAKAEDMIDRSHEGSHGRRIKEVGAQKGRRLPSDGVKEVEASGSGGDIKAGKKMGKDEISAGESSGDGAGAGIPGSGEDAGKAVAKGEKKPDKKAGFHYVECPKCESNFKVDKGVDAAPAHRCWAEEKEKAKQHSGNMGKAEKKADKKKNPMDGKPCPECGSLMDGVDGADGHWCDPGAVDLMEAKKAKMKKAGGVPSAKPAGVPGVPKPPQAPGAKPSAIKMEKAAVPGTVKGDALQGAHDAHGTAVTTTAPPPEPKAVPRSPSDYDMAAFQPKTQAPGFKAPAAGGAPKSPVKTHLERMKGAVSNMKQAVAKLPAVPAKPGKP